MNTSTPNNSILHSLKSAHTCLLVYSLATNASFIINFFSKTAFHPFIVRWVKLVFLLDPQPLQVIQSVRQSRIVSQYQIAISVHLLPQALYAFEQMRGRFHPPRT